MNQPNNSVLYDVDPFGVAWVTLNKPEKHNVFDEYIIARLTEIFQTITKDESVRAMVLSATGKSFCAGADLGWMQKMADYTHAENVEDATKLAGMLQALNTIPKPTIAKVQGAAFGGGVGLVCCCDMAVASQRASFSLSEVKIGLTPATISPYVVAAIGMRAARRYFLTAERISADKALQLGLVSEVCDEAELASTVQNWLDLIVLNSPAAIRASKQLIFSVASKPVDDELLLETSQHIADIRATAEAQEGLTAFFEKRSPCWNKHA